MTEQDTPRQQLTRIRTREIIPKGIEDPKPNPNATNRTQPEPQIGQALRSADEAAARESQRLRELSAFIESKKYIYPGEDGSLAIGGPAGMESLARGGPMIVVEGDEKSRAKEKEHGVPVYMGPVETQEKERMGSRARRAWKKLVS